jgi:hypothetical protein
MRIPAHSIRQSRTFAGVLDDMGRRRRVARFSQAESQDWRPRGERPCGGPGTRRILTLAGASVGCLVVQEPQALGSCEVLAGHAPARRRDWFGWPVRRQYSRKVPQQAWTRADRSGRGRTVTCTGTRGWTGCRWMACKRSGFESPIAPQARREIRKPEQRVQQQSTATATASDAVPPPGPAPSSSRAAGNASGSHVAAGTARPLSWRNALLLSPMTLAAHRCWPAIRTWTLAADAGGQGGLSSGRASIVPCEPGDMGAGAPRSPARRWPEPAARDTASVCFRARKQTVIECAFRALRRTPARRRRAAGASRAGRHRGRRAVGGRVSWCRGRQAADGCPSDRLWRPGPRWKCRRPSRGQPPRSGPDSIWQ